MNKRLHAGVIALGCLGALLAYAGWLGLTGGAEPWNAEPSGALRAPGQIMWCGDTTCGEPHP